MYVSICNIPIQLKTELQAVQNDWSQIFACHQIEATTTQFNITAESLQQAPPTDPKKPIQQFKAEFGTYTLAYTPAGRSKLTLASGAILCLPELTQTLPADSSISAEIYLSPQMVTLGQTEDVTLTVLAPLMRRFGVYIVHAFGVAHPSKNCAMLIIGSSGKGKTTTGLFLIKEGWRYFSNDAVFLSKNEASEIIAWPSPGKVNIHPKTLDLLGNPAFLQAQSAAGPDGKYHFPPSQIPNHLSTPLPVTLNLFPNITHQTGDCQFERLPSSIALSQTMGQSNDNWDASTLEDHFSFLGKLIAQTESYQTYNSRNLATLVKGVEERC